MGLSGFFSGLGGFSYCLEMLVAGMVFYCYLNKKKAFWLRIAAGIVMLFCCAKWIYPLFPNGNLWISTAWYGFVYLLLIFVSWFCCEISPEDAVYCASCAYLVQHLASSAYILLAFNGRVPTWSGPLYYAAFCATYVFVFLTIAKLLPENGRYDVSRLTSATTAIAAVSVTLILSTYVKTSAPLSDDAVAAGDYILLLKGSQIYAFAISLVFLVLQVLQRRELRKQKKLEQNLRIWEQRKIQYELSKENIDLINRKVHDLKHQIAALARTEGNDLRKKSFAAEVQDMIEVYDTDASTGNEALDTLLMEKGLYCKLHGIEWTCVADGMLLAFMDVVDLYTMMGNALDNAIESAENCDKDTWKTISVRIWKKDFFAVVQVENTFAGELQLEDGIPKTTKTDAENHGFGLRSIRTIAEKYDGTMTIKTEDQMFILTVLFPVS
jgi:hypothetical protein